ncbi:hypothetical protein ACVMIH_002397 [Bradyrhizobium sp. USDA 4503]
MANRIARRGISPVAMQAHFDRTAEVEMYKEFRRIIGDAALVERCRRLRAIAEDSGFPSELMRRQGDGDG